MSYFGSDTGIEHKVDTILKLIEALEESRSRHNEAQRIARLGHWTLDIVNNELLWSDETYRIFSVDPESLTASYEGFLNAVHPEDQAMVNLAYKESLANRTPYEVEHRLLLPDDSIKWVCERCETTFSEDGKALHSIGTVQDITDRKDAEIKIQHMAYHDQLTNLPNRNMFFDRLEQSLIRASRNMEKVAVCFLDLDSFKTINDSLGHDAGDVLLKQVSNRLRLCLREIDTVARIGGDEFAIILADANTQLNVTTVAEKIVETLAHPFKIKDKSINISVSIGVAISPEHGNQADALLRHADNAMYQVKRRSKNNYLFHNELETRAK